MYRAAAAVADLLIQELKQQLENKEQDDSGHAQHAGNYRGYPVYSDLEYLEIENIREHKIKNYEYHRADKSVNEHPEEQLYAPSKELE